MEIIIKIVAENQRIIISPTSATIGVAPSAPEIGGVTATALQSTYSAGEAIASFGVVALVDGLLYRASADTASHLNSVLGIALNSGSAGQQINVVTNGIVTNAGWNWADDTALFLGISGDILTTPDFEQNFIIQIGNAPSPNQINLDIDEPTIL